MKKVFLTGASSGIGLATARALLARGHEIWGTSRELNRLPQLEHFHPVQLDLRSADELGRVFMNCLREAGQFDVVVNNAGSGHFSAAEFLRMTEIADQFEILFFGPVRLIQLALAEMRSRGGGAIINVSSLAGRLPVPFMAAYNSAKAALAAFIMTLQVELSRSAIRIIDLQPADIRTNFNNAVIKTDNAEPWSAEMTKAWEIVDHNLRSAPGPELVANRIAALIEDANPPPRVTVGGLFQAGVAPLIFRFLPQRLRIWGLKNYYHLK